MMSRQKRELPLPGDVAPPPRRPLPGTPMAGPNQGPAPPLPSRGGGTPGRKALPTPEPPGKSVTSDDGDIYNEADVGEVYQECEPEQEEYSEFDVGAEVEEEPQETYDDFDIHADQQDTYEISDDVTDEVYQEMAEADPLPPPPPSRPIPQPPKNASPAPPPPPPPQSKRAPLEKKPARPKPPAVQKPMGGGLDLSEVLKKRGNLKKVESAEERPISSNDIKEYATGEDVRSKFEIFRQKEEADDSSSHADNLSVSSNIRDRMKMLHSNLPPPHKSQRTPPSLPKKTISNQIHPQTPTRPSQMKNNQFGRSASPDSHNFKSNFQTGSPELPPPPKMEDLQPPPPPKIKDSYTKVDPSTKSNVDSGKNTPLVQNGNQNDWPDDYDDDDGEIYDDVAATLADPLCAFPWYHNELEREEGNKKLKQISKDGCFLVRKASNKQRALTQPYTLMVYYSGYNYNLKVRLRSDQKFALGEEKADEVTFELVQDLICHHQKNEVILVHKSGKQYSTLLTVSPS